MSSLRRLEGTEPRLEGLDVLGRHVAKVAEVLPGKWILWGNGGHEVQPLRVLLMGPFATFGEKMGDPLKKESFTMRGSLIFPRQLATRPLGPKKDDPET